MERGKLTPKQWTSEHLEHLDDLPITRIVPSVLTLLGLCSGASAIPLAVMGNWKGAVAAIFSAMLFDMLDGRAARWLGADSRFGTQLDSLADLVSFGLAPAVVVYCWSLERMHAAGWIAALVFCVCSAIRLARFNIQALRDEGATESHPYFTGLPTPAAAGIVLLPLLLSFEFGNAVGQKPMFLLGLIAVTSILMVSHVPTPSLKYVKFGRRGRLTLFAGACVLAPLAVAFPWATAITGLMIYLVSILFVIGTQWGEDGTGLVRIRRSVRRRRRGSGE